MCLDGITTVCPKLRIVGLVFSAKVYFEEESKAEECSENPFHGVLQLVRFRAKGKSRVGSKVAEGCKAMRFMEGKKRTCLRFYILYM